MTERLVLATLLATTGIANASFAEEITAAGPASGTASSAISQGANEIASGDIIVTALKRSEILRDVPMSITAISGSELTQKGINNVADLVKMTPGLSYVETGNSVPIFSLRGVGFFDTALGARPTVSVYVDEAPLPFSIMASGASFDLERVEVLKGPQGTLFGQNATGGAINYIAAKPTSDFKAGVTASYARFNTVDLQGYVSGPIADTLGIRVAGRIARSNGWQRSYTRDDELGDRNFSQGRVLIDWRPTDRLTITANLNGFVDKGDTQAGQKIAVYPSQPALISQIPLIANHPNAPADPRAADWQSGQDFSRDNRFYQASLRATYELSDAVSLTSLTSYSHMRIRQHVDGDGTSVANVQPLIRGTLSSISQEVRLNGQSGALQWIAGGNYSRDKADEDDIFYWPYSTVRALFSRFGDNDGTEAYSRQIFTTKAVFANLDLEVAPQLKLHGGLRRTWADLDYEGCTKAFDQPTATGFTNLFNAIRAARGLAPFAPLQAGDCVAVDTNILPGLLTGKLDQRNTAWRVGIDFKPGERSLIYANISRGFKAGSTTVIPVTSLSQLVPIAQEQLTAYEVGFRTSAFDRRLNLNGAAFYYDYRDKQLRGRAINQPNLFGAVDTLINIPKSRILGVEAQAAVRPTRELTLTVAGTYLDSKVQGSFVNFSILGTQLDLAGSAFPYTPKWQVVAQADYRRPITGSVDGFAGVNYNYRSKTKGGFGVESILDIDSYGLLDLRAGVADHADRWRAELFGRNVTNAYYWTNVARFVDVVRRLAGPPATYGVQVAYKF